MIDDLLHALCDGAANALALIVTCLFLGGIFVGAVIASLF